VPDGARLSTKPAGRHTFTVTATSSDGQTTTKTVTYNVKRPSNGFSVGKITAASDGSVTIHLKFPGPGIVNILETAWDNNLASTSSLLHAAKGRFVFARKHLVVSRAGSITITIKPWRRGRLLVANPRYLILLRVFVSYTPTGGTQRNRRFNGVPLKAP
jgi:hypothetical protein